ncbi:MAG: TetR/AcrR family transcriptional regulator C-terminal domain-containing protein [Jatrophihabitans sp.]
MSSRRAPSRTARGTITREAVIAKAVEVASSEHSAELSMRSLAAELGVSAMALYRHVENKEDLLDEVVGRLLADRWRPAIGAEDWRAWIIEAADRFRQFLVDEPLARQVYLRRPVVSPTAMARMDACLGALRVGVPDEQTAHSVFATLQMYTIGFAALEAARASPAAEALDDRVDPERLRELRAYTSHAQFEEGLAILLRGAVTGADQLR